jgi:hypothetical protein
MRLAIRLSEHKSGQKSFDSESFDYFKSSEELEMVSMMKSVPNLISYLQKFSQIFSSPCSHFFLCGRPISSISEKRKNVDKWGPPVSG